MSDYSNLTLARKTKNDEFYTKYSDIEKEISQYKQQLSGKIIYCNCDDPHKSKFVKFFLDNFKLLKLKNLYVTGYNINYFYNYDGTSENKIPIQSNGDFRSEECVELLKQSDIVITNPPFSLFREFLKLLVENNKQFLILGNINDAVCKSTFHLLRDKKFWLGKTKGKFIFDSQSGPKAFRQCQVVY